MSARPCPEPGCRVPVPIHHKYPLSGWYRRCNEHRKAYRRGEYVKIQRKARQSQRVYMARRAAKRAAYLREYLLTHPCVDCGLKAIGYLEFDHVRGTKRGCLGDFSKVTNKYLDEEIAKCDVRCSACHRDRHTPQRACHRDNDPFREAVVQAHGAGTDS